MITNFLKSVHYQKNYSCFNTTVENLKQVLNSDWANERKSERNPTTNLIYNLPGSPFQCPVEWAGLSYQWKWWRHPLKILLMSKSSFQQVLIIFGWWWFSGRNVCLLLWHYELKSCWRKYLFLKNWLKRMKIEKE